MEGDNIRSIREELNLKLSWVALRAGMGKDRLSRIERNERKASLNEGFRIAEAMEVDIRRFRVEESDAK